MVRTNDWIGWSRSNYENDGNGIRLSAQDIAALIEFRLKELNSVQVKVENSIEANAYWPRRFRDQSPARDLKIVMADFSERMSAIDRDIKSMMDLMIQIHEGKEVRIIISDDSNAPHL